MTIMDTHVDLADAPMLDDQGSDKFSHIVVEGFWFDEGEIFKTASELGVPGGSVVESQVMRTPIKALCGKQWTATDNPRKYSLCPTCKEIAERQGWRIPAA